MINPSFSTSESIPSISTSIRPPESNEVDGTKEQPCVERHRGHQELGNNSPSEAELQHFKKPRISETELTSRMPESVRPQVCLQFKRAGRCRYGASCVYAHVTGEHTPNVLELESQDQNLRSCWFYRNGEECPYGDRCRFPHRESQRANRGQLWSPRDSVAINVVSMGQEGKTISGVHGLNYEKLEGKQMLSQKALSWKTKICHKWERFGNCNMGARCSFAHGREELQKVHDPALLETQDAYTGKTIATVASGIETASTNVQQKQKKSLIKCTDIKKISRIYADWIEAE